MNRRPLVAARAPEAFTLIELLVVIAIIAILAAILFPVFAQARAKARQSACISNLKQIGTAILMYAQDADETFPPGENNIPCPPDLQALGVCAPPTVITASFLYFSQPYSKNNLYSRCPDAKELVTSCGNTRRFEIEGRVGYGMAWPVPGRVVSVNDPPNVAALVANFGVLAQMKNPAGHVLVMDGVPDGSTAKPTQYDPCGIYQPRVNTPVRLADYGLGGSPAGFHQRPHGRHNGLVSTLFCDGHVKATQFDQLYPMKETVCAAGNGLACNNTGQSPAVSRTSHPALWELWGY